MKDLNLDAIGENISTVIRNFVARSRPSNGEYSETFEPLPDSEIDNLFRGDFLIQKIISKYPKSAKSNGYKLLNNHGEVISESDNFILDAFCEASIMARKYGKSYLILSDENKNNIQLSKNSKLVSYKIKFDLIQEGLFYDADDEKVHRSKVFIFFGNRTYLKDIHIDDTNYSDSIIQGLKKSFFIFTNSNSIAYYILSNLSYLTMGIDGLGNKVKNEQGQNVVLERLLAVNLGRDLSRILAYEKGKEEIGFVSQTFSGVSDINADIKSVLVTYSDYPTDQLFEDSPKQNIGTGIANQLIARMLWASRLKRWTEENWLSNYIRLFSTLFGEGNKIEIPFVVEMTELEKAEIEEKGANRISKLMDKNVLNINEARTGYKGDDYTLNIVLDDEFENLPETSTPESKKEDNEQINNENNQDATVKDSFWDDFANIDENDLINIAKSVLIPGE
jgi:hypothetical protein